MDDVAPLPVAGALVHAAGMVSAALAHLPGGGADEVLHAYYTYRGLIGRESNSTETIYAPSRPAPASAAFTLRRAASVPGSRARCQSRDPGVPREVPSGASPDARPGRPARGT